MKWYRSFAIVRKEFWEFRKQKYIIYSLLLLPIIFAVFLPSFTFTAILSQVATVDPNAVQHYLEENGSPSINLTVNSTSFQSYFDNNTADGIGFMHHVYFDNVTALGINADNCIFESSYVRDHDINHSILRNCTIVTGVIKNSLLINVTVKSTIVINCTGVNVSQWDSSVVRSDNLDVVSNNGVRMLDIVDLLLNTYCFMLVLAPVIAPTVIASYTFVGEKNNKSLEPLLATPATDNEILWGKILAILIPTLLATLLSFVIFAVVTNFVFSEHLGYSPLPNEIWVYSLIVIAPLICFLSVAVNIIISSRMSDVRASQQVGSIVVLPVILMFIGGFSGVISFGAASILLLGAILLVADALVFLLVKKSFQRENILIKWK